MTVYVQPDSNYLAALRGPRLGFPTLEASSCASNSFSSALVTRSTRLSASSNLFISGDLDVFSTASFLTSCHTTPHYRCNCPVRLGPHAEKTGNRKSHAGQRLAITVLIRKAGLNFSEGQTSRPVSAPATPRLQIALWPVFLLGRTLK